MIVFLNLAVVGEVIGELPRCVEIGFNVKTTKRKKRHAGGVSGKKTKKKKKKLQILFSKIPGTASGGSVRSTTQPWPRVN